MNKNIFLTLVLSIGLVGFAAAEDNDNKANEQQKQKNVQVPQQEAQQNNQQSAQSKIEKTSISVEEPIKASKTGLIQGLGNGLAWPFAIIGLASTSEWIKAHPVYAVLGVLATSGAIAAIANTLLADEDADDYDCAAY